MSVFIQSYDTEPEARRGLDEFLDGYPEYLHRFTADVVPPHAKKNLSDLWVAYAVVWEDR
jgi:hypothetical protein